MASRAPHDSAAGAGATERAASTAPQAAGAPRVLEVDDLRTYFYTEEGEIRAVDGVSFELRRGRTLALVGESGCGKSVTAYSVLRLINPPGKIVGGSIRLHGGPGEPPLDILSLDERGDELHDVRGGRVAFVFQEATAALSPVHTIGNQITEAIALHQKLSRRAARKLAVDMLGRVGIVNPELCLRQYPHELSGGMRQRAVIAMALVTNPELLIADEPTTALDVTIQAQILALLKQLQAELDMSILLITHDLGVVSQMADEVIVMYLGRIVERGPVRNILKRPRHPYTMGLLASLPSLTPVGRRLPSIRGSVPALSDIPAGCSFHPRCPHAEPGRCNVGDPPVLEPGTPASLRPGARSSLPPAAPGASARPAPPGGEHFVACHRAREIALERLMHGYLPGSSAPASGDAPSSRRPGMLLGADAQGDTSQAGAARSPDSKPSSMPNSAAETDTEAAWFEAGDRDSERPGGEW